MHTNVPILNGLLNESEFLLIISKCQMLVFTTIIILLFMGIVSYLNFFRQIQFDLKVNEARFARNFVILEFLSEVSLPICTSLHY